MENALKTIFGIINNTIIPPLDKVASASLPKTTGNIKNVWAEYHEMKGRPMVYPYTYISKLVQFPWKYHFKHGWAVKYYIFGFLASIPFMHKLSTLVNTKSNKEKWRKIREDWYGPHSHH